jgi:hypothetical protein
MDISLCASAIRVEHWLETYNSLSDNNVSWELIYVGPNTPNFTLPNLKYIKSNVKPAQCYEIAFRVAQGRLLHWTADDTLYPPKALDNIVSVFDGFQTNELVVAFRTVEDGKDITAVHRFRGRDMNAPAMAPFGVMNREFFHSLGGYDRRFICGQSENDVVMRVYEVGGILIVSNIPVYVNHQKAHDSSTVFRSGFYHEDRKVLESAWVLNNVIQNKRIVPVERFEGSIGDLISTTQSQKGIWL